MFPPAQRLSPLTPGQIHQQETKIYSFSSFLGIVALSDCGVVTMWYSTRHNLDRRSKKSRTADGLRGHITNSELLHKNSDGRVFECGMNFFEPEQ